MKRTALLITIAFMHLHASAFAQLITLQQKNVPLSRVLKEFRKQTGYNVLWSVTKINQGKPVDVNLRNTPLREALDQVLKDQPFTYEIEDKNVIIKLKTASVANVVNQATGTTQALNPVKGKVADDQNQPLAGATVSIKGKNIVTITDENGQFTIDATPTDILLFSYAGFVTAEKAVGNGTHFTISLQRAIDDLHSVVVVGFGTQKKVNLTGAVSTVSSKSLETRPVSNVAQALQGMVPGLNITQSGALGGSLQNRPTMNIRGVGTIGEGSRSGPLILIDGMEGDINALNPQDIDNISVLKDASASSIYGSRAPFGVILVTTKQGKAGKPQITFGSNYRVSSPVLLPHPMDSYTFATYFNDARLNSGQGVYFTPERMQRIKDYQAGIIKTTLVPRPGQPNLWADGYLDGNDNVDWYRVIYRTQTPAQDYSASVSGGKENVNYYLAGQYLNQTGLMNLGGDHASRYNVTARIGAKLSNYASITYIGRFSREESDRPSYMTNTLNQKIANQGWPVLPLYDNNGYLYDAPSWALSLRDGGRGAIQEDNISQQLKLNIEPVKGWKIAGDLNYSINDVFYHWELLRTYNYDVAGNPYPAKTASEAHEEASRSNYVNLNFYTEYKRSLGVHNFKALAGVQSELYRTRIFKATRQGIIVPELTVIDATSGNDPNGKPVPPTVSGNNRDWSTMGYFGRLNYDYAGKYLFEASLRYDGASRFRPERRWVYNPSASIGWNLDRENFWAPMESYINTFKIRGSYGQLSNQNTSDWYPTYPAMPVGSSNGNWLINGVRPNTSAAPGLVTSSLSWETVRIWNIGADLSFLKSRLTATVEFFKRFTDNMIGPAPELPVILGTAVPKANNTNLQTTGFELDIAWKDRLSNGLGYSIHGLLSDSRTRITKYPNPTGNLPTETATTYNEGHLTGEIWGYKTIGIARSQEEMDKHLAGLPNGGQNALGSNWKAGDLMFEDVNGDGKINAGANTVSDHGDLVLIGNKTPRYLVGLDLGADWKGFDFRAFFQGVLKRDYFINNYYFWGASTTIYSSAGLREHADYFRDDPDHPLGLNLDSYYPRPLLSTKNQVQQSGYLLNAAYIRLKNLQLGYSLPGSLTRKIGIQKFRAYISGENLFTITKMATMFDPETVDGGWEGSAYPLMKVYSIGATITL